MIYELFKSIDEVSIFERTCNVYRCNAKNTSCFKSTISVYESNYYDNSWLWICLIYKLSNFQLLNLFGIVLIVKPSIIQLTSGMYLKNMLLDSFLSILVFMCNNIVIIVYFQFCFTAYVKHPVGMPIVQARGANKYITTILLFYVANK